MTRQQLRATARQIATKSLRDSELPRAARRAMARRQAKHIARVIQPAAVTTVIAAT